MSHAFRCKNCNSLEESGAAGERDVPAKCRTCGAGVSFTPDGIKTYDPDNWAVLADLPAGELADVLEYHAIGADEIEAHVPFKTEFVDGEHVASPLTGDEPAHEPVIIDVETVDEARVEDKVTK